MKKNLFILVTVTLFLCMISGCRPKNPVDMPEPTPGPDVTEPPTPAYSIADYFPFQENTLYKYIGVGSDFLTQDEFMLYANDSGAQILASNIDHDINTDVYRMEDGKLKVIFMSYEYFYDNLLDTADIKNMTILQEPLELGRTWPYDSEGAISEITNLNAKTIVPLGEFDALEVTTTHYDVVRRDYYAPGVGLIQTSYDLGSTKISRDLSEIIWNASKTVEIDICVVNTTLGRLEFEKRPLTLTSNIDFVQYFNTLLKEPLPVDYQPMLPGNSSIRSMSVDWPNVLLTVDLSKDYVQNIDVGAGIESDMLQALANTLGNFYNVWNVEILLDGNRYESGHILRHEGEYWEVEPVVYPEPEPVAPPQGS